MSKTFGCRFTEEDYLKSVEPFKRFILRKEGKLHGALGREIARALSHYLSCSSVQTNTNSPKGLYRRDRLRRIIAVFNALPNDAQFKKSLVESVIDATAKVGRVTKKEYFNFMEGWGMIIKLQSDLFVASARASIETRYEKGVLPQWIKEELES
jgi:hypothetical protein